MTIRTRDSRGLTLVELIVVLTLLGLAAAMVAPAFIVPEREDGSRLQRLLDGTRSLAARRGEIVYLTVERSGNWWVEGSASPAAGRLAEGRIDDYERHPFTVVVSPLGSCGFDVRSDAAAASIPLDPLTCRLREP